MKGIPLNTIGQQLANSQWVIIFSLGVTFLFTMLGGFVAASLVNHNRTLIGFIASLPCLLMNLIDFFSPFPHYFLTWMYVLSLLGIPVSIWGALFAAKK